MARGNGDCPKKELKKPRKVRGGRKPPRYAVQAARECSALVEKRGSQRQRQRRLMMSDGARYV
jgi:hypothetical protein